MKMFSSSQELPPPDNEVSYGLHKVWHYQHPAVVHDLLLQCMRDLRIDGGDDALTHDEL